MTLVWILLAQFMWLHMYTGDIVNVALNKTANMSSRHNPILYSPVNGVDGNSTSIIHTRPEQPFAWWTVDLGTQVQDAVVTIYFRLSNVYRRNGVQFWTSTTPFSSYPGGQSCLNFTSRTGGRDIPNNFSETCSGTWRHLMVYSGTTNDAINDKGPILDFGEVTIDGCNGTYGWNCDKPCSHHCAVTPTSCDRNSGACREGCEAGWKRANCSEECSHDEYGANCNKSCSSRHCDVQSPCHRILGACDGTCEAGWRGIDCAEECRDDMYGANCTNSCSSRHCVVPSTKCNRFNGSCSIEGCQAGWKGIDCTVECPDDMYGANCTNSCSSRYCEVSSTTCNRFNGSCSTEGCQVGWKGIDCTTECMPEMYGVNCVKNCSSRHCVVSSTTCHHETGVCPRGCRAGWKGTDCSEECFNGTYWKNCSKSCRSRQCASSPTSCDRYNGTCSDGCKPGWKGNDCSQKCHNGNYGQNCNMTCAARECKTSSASCDHMTGQCDDGCKPGWNGTDCIHECTKGTYGDNCSKDCEKRHCLISTDACDRVNGECSKDRCKPGWRGPDCAKECPENTFGPSCTPCSIRHCRGGSDCPEDGTCAGGCQDGWTPDNCTQEQYSASPDYIDSKIIPAVSGAVAGLLGVAIVVVVIIVYRRRRRFSSHEKKEQAGNHSNGNNMYVNVDEIRLETGKVQTQNSQPEVPADPEQEEEIPDEGAASPSTDYYNESVEVIREVAVADLVSTIQKIKQREGGFGTEYSRLSTGFTASYDDSQKPENAGKNKFRGLYPYDHNRVRLSTLPNIPGSDYINASLMHSYDQKKTYIAAQAPNKKTVGDFWRMIWEERCGQVIMLTGLMEEAKVKCYQYWPKEDVLETDHHRVEVEVTDTRADYTIRHLKVTSKKNGDQRTVIQYHYTSWPDHGVPDTLALVHFIWMIRRTGTPGDGPLLVHCSAGIGRTGTYIAVDSLLDQARNEGKVDVLGYVSTMRSQRKNMIQTKEQYECVFQCLLEMTTFGNTSMNVENFITSYSSRGMDSMVDRKTIREITQMMRTRDCKDSPGRHRMWVDGNQKFIVRVGPTLKHLKGYLQTVAPPTGLEKLLWKLVEENDVHNVIIVSPIQVDLVGETGGTKKYGEITVTTIGQTNLTSDLALVTLQLKAMNEEKSQTVKLFKCAGSNTVEGMSQHLLDHAHFYHLSDEMSPVVLIHSEPNRKGVVYLCIMGNILAGILKDRCVDVIGHVRTFLKCCPDVTLTAEDVEKLLEFSQKCIEMTESTNTYANL